MAIRNNQKSTLHAAKRALKLADAAYRTVLRNCAGVESAADDHFTQEGFDRVMAVLEAHGFQSHPRGSTYWRDQAERGGGRATWKVYVLAAQSRYAVAEMCSRMSEGRALRPEDLTPAELHKLIEMFKSSNAREQRPLKKEPSHAGLFG